MNSVGNLTEFMREHMLEALPVEVLIAAPIAHCDDLHRAHEAALKAKRQIEQLMPLMADSGRHRALVERESELRNCRDALRPGFAELKSVLRENRLQQPHAYLDNAAALLARMGRERLAQSLRHDELRQAISDSGGQQLTQIDSEIARQQASRVERSRIAWLGDKNVIYWGNIDTYGFAILDRSREQLPHRHEQERLGYMWVTQTITATVENSK